MRYNDIKLILEKSLKEKSIDEVEKILKDMIENDKPNSLKYQKAFFSLIKDLDLKKAIEYGEEIILVEEDPKFLKVLAVRYKRNGDIKKYNSLSNKKIPLLELKQTLKIYSKDLEKWTNIEDYINDFIENNSHLKKDIYKIVFSILKDSHTVYAIEYGEKVLEYEKNFSFIKVLANRYKRLGNISRYQELLELFSTNKLNQP